MPVDSCKVHQGNRSSTLDISQGNIGCHESQAWRKSFNPVHVPLDQYADSIAATLRCINDAKEYLRIMG